MTVCAGLLVKDESDIVEPIVRWWLSQVDHVIVLDNGSTDGTSEILARLAAEYDPGLDSYSGTLPPRGLLVRPDTEVGYFQAQKMSALASEALTLGHQWFIPCDADEFWYANDGRRIADFLAGLAPDVGFVSAPIFNHLPTSNDPPLFCSGCDGTRQLRVEYVPVWPDPPHNEIHACEVCQGRVETNPLIRIGYRQREHGALGKIVVRCRPGVEIRMGNHSAFAPGSGVTAGGLTIRHFSWRSAAQYVKKIRNGALAYAATDYPEDVGAHWRMFGPPDEPTFDERVVDHFRTWFLIQNPAARADLIYDPAPLR